MTYEDLSNVSDFCLCADLSYQRATALEALDPMSGGAFLDIGCGLGHLCRDAELVMGRRSLVVGLDQNWENVAFAASFDTDNCHYLQADALSLPLRSGSIDYAACIQVAEYVPDTRALARNVHRVLRKGGKALFVSTDWPNMFWSAANPSLADAVTALWSKHCVHSRMHASLPRHLEEAGFIVEKSWVHTIRNSTFDETQYSYGLIKMIRSFASLTRNSDGRPMVDSLRAHLQELHEQGRYDFRLDRRFHLISRR